jgi:hypothetical protein
MSRVVDAPEYQVWRGMKKRCHCQTDRGRKNYAARGIIVCERWRSSFKDFVSDMGPRPTPEHSIERINNDGNYEPGNCRWATAEEQARNRRSTKNLTYEGVTQCITAWAIERGISENTLRARLDELWPIEQALGFAPREFERVSPRRDRRAETARVYAAKKAAGLCAVRACVAAAMPGVLLCRTHRDAKYASKKRLRDARVAALKNGTAPPPRREPTRANAIINESVAAKMKTLRAEGISVKEIAARLGCSYGVTYNVVTGLAWKDVAAAQEGADPAPHPQNPVTDAKWRAP